MSKSAWVKTNHLPPQKEALLTRKNGTKNFARFGKNGKKGNTSKGITFSPENVHPDEPFHLNSPRNYRVFHANGLGILATEHASYNARNLHLAIRINGLFPRLFGNVLFALL